MLKICKTKEDKKLKVSLAGRLDTAGAPKVEYELRPALVGIKELEFDISELSYLSSAGLRVLLSAQKSMDMQQGTMVISGASEEVMGIFEDTGFIDILNLV